MPPAARVGDKTSHGGTIGPPAGPAAASVARVLIAGEPAAVVGSVHVCVVPLHIPLGPANVILPRPSAVTKGLVLIGGLPAACVGDKTACQATVLPPGALNVLIGGAL